MLAGGAVAIAAVVPVHQPLTLGDECFFALPEHALFWPRHEALILADLHLEKASWYAAHGQPLPPYDSIDTLDRLAKLAQAWQAKAIWCLGDSFHDRDAAARIGPAVAARLRHQTQNVQFIWVAGNHDGLVDEAWGGTVADELTVDGIVLRHQSIAADDRPEISGHFHPKLRIAARGRLVSRPCFASDGQRLILPAFGSLTGGLDVQDRAIAINFSGFYAALVPTRQQLLRFPCSPVGAAARSSG